MEIFVEIERLTASYSSGTVLACAILRPQIINVKHIYRDMCRVFKALYSQSVVCYDVSIWSLKSFKVLFVMLIGHIHYTLTHPTPKGKKN